MLEKEDLQALRAIIKEEITASEQRTDAKLAAQEARLDAKFAAQEARLDEKLSAMENRMDIKLAENKRDIMQGVSVLMEQEFRPQFALLAEGQQLLREKLEPLNDLPVWETRISALEAAVKKLNRDMAELKKAQ